MIGEDTEFVEKHAYLIMAHGQFDLLRRLLYLLDDERNDLFIHIDAKAKDFEESDFSNVAIKSKCYYVDRVNVYWGSRSIVKATYNLLKKATEVGKYNYYHLLSGADLPIKTQNYIHELLCGCNKEIIHFGEEQPKERVAYYHLFEDDYRGKSVYKKATRKLFLMLQKLFHTDRTKGDSFKIMHGSAWFSITDDFARYVLSREAMVLKRYKWTRWPDESFIQTLLYNSKYKDRLYIPLEKQVGNHNDCLRAIDWRRGKPYVWRIEDYDELMNSECLFARKFDSQVDKSIIDRIENSLMEDLESIERSNTFHNI